MIEHVTECPCREIVRFLQVLGPADSCEHRADTRTELDATADSELEPAKSVDLLPQGVVLPAQVQHCASQLLETSDDGVVPFSVHVTCAA